MTHDIREALYLADRIVVLKAGAVAAVLKNQTGNTDETRVAEMRRCCHPEKIWIGQGLVSINGARLVP